jgi:hypothetical protein
MFFDRGHPTFFILLFPFPHFEQFLVGFIMLSSYIYIIYFYNVHPLSPLLFPFAKQSFTIMSYFFRPRFYVWEKTCKICPSERDLSPLTRLSQFHFPENYLILFFRRSILIGWITFCKDFRS